VAVVDPPMVDVLPDKPRTRGIARTKAGKARTATRSVAARCAGEHQTHEPKIGHKPESRPVFVISQRLKIALAASAPNFFGSLNGRLIKLPPGA